MRNYEIKTDLHTHTLASTHAYSTLEENCRGAFANGLEGINMSDHGPSMPDAPYEGHFSNMRILPEYIHGIKVWKGAEANIVDYEGRIDLTEHTLGRHHFMSRLLRQEQLNSTQMRICRHLKILRFIF